MRKLNIILIAWVVLGLSAIITDVLILHNPIRQQIKLIQLASIIPINGIVYKIDDPLIVKVDEKQYIVPTGFETDLASIPRFLWPFIAPNESNTVFPAILHDYLYSCPGALARLEADKALYSFLIEEGVSIRKAKKFYYAVRLFGSGHFKKGITC